MIVIMILHVICNIVRIQEPLSSLILGRILVLLSLDLFGPLQFDLLYIRRLRRLGLRLRLFSLIVVSPPTSS